jgi:tRNA (cmo5U34)-methyltransferase
MQDHFKEKAKDWDKGDIRVQNAKSIANAITKEVNLHAKMDLMDFGVGTGLLGFEVLKHVQSMVGVDTSASMLEKLEAKNTPELFIKPELRDLVSNPIDNVFDGVVSSMTLHHVEKIADFFNTLKNNIKEDGFVAIADLESEDGTFHSDNTGVYHFGFEPEELKKKLVTCGYKDVKVQTIYTIEKPHKTFNVFLLTAFA